MRKPEVRSDNARFWFRIDFGEISFSIFNITKFIKLPKLDIFTEGSLTELVNAIADKVGEKDVAAFRILIVGLLACFSILIFSKIIESI